METTESVAVCIATFRRPDQLEVLLEDLASQKYLATIPRQVLVCVADNDPDETARDVVDNISASDSYPHDLVYTAVPERGVVPVRNALVAMAVERGADWIAFIDDDERPIDTWLALLLDTAIETGASSVAGPVPERFSFDPPDWYTGAGLHIAESFPTGSAVKRFGVGNLLVSTQALLEVGSPPFDQRFNATGGEDVYLGFQLTRAGHRMVWCNEAIATTDVPVERTRFRWVVRRQFNAYRNYSRALRIAEGRQPWSELAKSLGRLGEAFGRVLLGAARRDKGAMAAGAHLGAGALGKFAGTADSQDSGWWD